MLTVFVVSDATGATAEKVVRSALVQFEEAPVKLLRRRRVRTADQVRAVMQEASACGDCMVVHTLVSDENFVARYRCVRNTVGNESTSPANRSKT